MEEPSSLDSDRSRLQRILTMLKSLLKKDLWDASFLLKRKKKALESQVVSLEEVLNSSDQTHTSDLSSLTQSLPEGQVALYISLFQKDGDRLLNWELAIAALPSRSGGRPIYRTESEARQWISSRGNSVNEGFVRVIVNQEDVVTTERRDALGQPLVGIKERVLKLEAIDSFVHFNEVSYKVLKGKLIKQIDQ